MAEEPTDIMAAARLMRLATYLSVATATLLAILKLAAWILTDSVSLLSTLIDSLLDVAASLVTLFAIRQALTPPDAEHRFGHGKAEPLAALGQAAFIAGSSLLLFVQAGPRLVHPQPLTGVDDRRRVRLFDDGRATISWSLTRVARR